jgi:hypothetical protein
VSIVEPSNAIAEIVFPSQVGSMMVAVTEATGCEKTISIGSDWPVFGVLRKQVVPQNGVGG